VFRLSFRLSIWGSAGVAAVGGGDGSRPKEFFFIFHAELVSSRAKKSRATTHLVWRSVT